MPNMQKEKKKKIYECYIWLMSSQIFVWNISREVEDVDLYPSIQIGQIQISGLLLTCFSASHMSTKININDMCAIELFL